MDSNFNKRAFLKLLGAGAVVAATTQVTLASYDDDQTSELGEETKSDAAFSRIVLAHSLIQYGREEQNPEALVTAATILSRVAALEEDENGTAIDKKATEAKRNAEAEALLEEASNMRASDKVLQELVSRARESLKESGRSLTYDPGLEKVRQAAYKLGAKQRKIVSIGKVKKGSKVSASTSQAVMTGIIAIDTSGNQIGPVLASGKGSTKYTATKDTNLAVVVTNNGQASTTGSLAIKTN